MYFFYSSYTQNKTRKQKQMNGLLERFRARDSTYDDEMELMKLIIDQMEEREIDSNEFNQHEEFLFNAPKGKKSYFFLPTSEKLFFCRYD